ncbi:probable disease resistance RPP8-like protein 2 [Mercurialis annua]|uniref:probable disease resistance RPP8-like protein 2 n=1 Tax=Mercurialis annua TaxID=3986 RepID=UPI002160A4C9|nr:probable disease resistance RPP8-like protein 2 [Mercurialis annua]
MASVKDIALAVLGKVSNLLVQEPDSLLGVDGVMEQIECILRERVYATSSFVVNEKNVREVLYDIEDAIDELVTRAAHTRNRFSFVHDAVASVDLPKHFFYVLAVDDLIDHYQIHKKLKQLKGSVPFKYRFGYDWHASLQERSFDLHHLRRASRKVPNKENSREVVYNIQDDIDEFVFAVRNRRWRVALINSVLAFADLPKQFSYVLALTDLLDHYQIHNKLEQLKRSLISDWFDYTSMRFGGLWENSFGLDLNAAGTITFPVINKLEGLVSQRSLINSNMRKRARGLRDESKCLDEFIRQADSKELTEEGIAWMEELCDVCRSAENVVGLFMDYQQQRMKNGSGEILKSLIFAPQNFISQHKLSHQMALIQVRMCAISGRRYRAFKSHVSLHDTIYPQREFHSLHASNQLDMVSFDEDVDAVTAQLLKEDPRCITVSIVGVKGIGKTSLASLIYNSQAIAHHFPFRIWVSGEGVHSNNEIMKKILRLRADLDLAFHLNETYDSYKYRVRRMVNARLEDKRHLIVIDGCWNAAIWKEMGYFFSEVLNGTRILFTVSHQKRSPPVTETDFTYRLHLRNDDESWALFTHTLNTSIPLELENNLKEDILRRCGGLPEVIVKLGKQISRTNATLEDWSTMLSQFIQDEEPWSEILEEINKHLPLYLRRCLFYFGLFPASYRVPARRLVALWVAEGLGRQQDDSKPPEYVAEEYLRELVNDNMVQVTKKKLNGKIKTCCLPEALRLHWYTKAKEANFLKGHNDKSGGTRRLADHLDPNDALFDHIHGNNSTSLFPCYSNVVSFLSFDTREDRKAGEDIGKFLDRCISSHCFYFLWVLDLECIFKPKLPKAVTRLIRLKYLGLRSTYLEILPVFIDKLLGLQTLDLKRTCITNLPRSIWKMQKLRHLFLDESSRSKFVPRQESTVLVELQTLWGVFIDEDSPVKNGLDTLSNITKLGLKCKLSSPSQKVAMSSQLETVENWVGSLRKLQSLRLKSFDESNQPWDLHLQSLVGHVDLTSIYLVGKFKNPQLVSELPKNLMELTLSASGLGEDPMQTLEKLPNLKILILLLGSYTGKKMLCKCGGFPKLEVFKLKKLVQLEEWNMEEGSMAWLKELEIESCSNLEMLPNGLRFVMFLRDVKLIKLAMLSSKLKDKQNEDWNKIAHVQHVFIED